MIVKVWLFGAISLSAYASIGTASTVVDFRNLTSLEAVECAPDGKKSDLAPPTPWALPASAEKALGLSRVDHDSREQFSSAPRAQSDDLTLPPERSRTIPLPVPVWSILLTGVALLAMTRGRRMLHWLVS